MGKIKDTTGREWDAEKFAVSPIGAIGLRVSGEGRFGFDHNDVAAVLGRDQNGYLAPAVDGKIQLIVVRDEKGGAIDPLLVRGSLEAGRSQLMVADDDGLVFVESGVTAEERKTALNAQYPGQEVIIVDRKDVGKHIHNGHFVRANTISLELGAQSGDLSSKESESPVRQYDPDLAIKNGTSQEVRLNFPMGSEGGYSGYPGMLRREFNVGLEAGLTEGTTASGNNVTEQKYGITLSSPTGQYDLRTGPAVQGKAGADVVITTDKHPLNQAFPNTVQGVASGEIEFRPERTSGTGVRLYGMQQMFEDRPFGKPENITRETAAGIGVRLDLGTILGNGTSLTASADIGGAKYTTIEEVKPWDPWGILTPYRDDTKKFTGVEKAAGIEFNSTGSVATHVEANVFDSKPLTTAGAEVTAQKGSTAFSVEALYQKYKGKREITESIVTPERAADAGPLPPVRLTLTPEIQQTLKVLGQDITFTAGATFENGEKTVYKGGINLNLNWGNGGDKSNKR